MTSKGFVKYPDGSILMELNAYPTNGRYSINYHGDTAKQTPEIASKKVLKFAMVKSYTQSRQDLLDETNMKCLQGLLCHVYNSMNGPHSDKEVLSCCVGFLMDILLELQYDLHIQFDVYEVEDHQYGAKVNGSWNGLIGDVASGKADIAGLNAPSTSRMEVVDFTRPCLLEDLVLASRIEVSPLPFMNTEAFDALTLESWISIFCVTLITAGIIYMTERLVFLPSGLETGCDIFTYAMGLLFQRDIAGRVPHYLGSQVVSVALAMTLMIVMTTYTAVLTTRNIENRETFSCSGMNDTKITQPTPAFKIGTFKDSFISQMFESNHLQKWRNLGEFMKPYNFHHLSEAYERFQTGQLHAIIIERIYLEAGWTDGKFCDIQVVENIGKMSETFILKKGSLWNEAISNLMLKYRENGLLNEIRRKHMAKHCETRDTTLPHQFSIRYLSAACVMLLDGIILSVVCLVVEYVIKVYVINKRKSYNLSHIAEARNMEQRE